MVHNSITSLCIFSCKSQVVNITGYRTNPAGNRAHFLYTLPRVVIAEGTQTHAAGTVGLAGSKGIYFYCMNSSTIRAISSCLPLTSVPRRSTSIKWLSVPPPTRLFLHLLNRCQSLCVIKNLLSIYSKFRFLMPRQKATAFGSNRGASADLPECQGTPRYPPSLPARFTEDQTTTWSTQGLMCGRSDNIAILNWIQGAALAATRPAICAISIIKNAPTESAISRKRAKSNQRGRRLRLPRSIFGWCSLASCASSS